MLSLEECLQSLKARGQKMTPQRREILSAIIDSRKPLTARDLHGRVRRSFPGVSLDTVYRNLLLLTASGLVSQINLQNKGIARFEFQGSGHHHHAICLECGASFCIDNCVIPATIPSPREDRGFKIVSHAFEVYGVCSKCAS